MQFARQTITLLFHGPSESTLKRRNYTKAVPKCTVFISLVLALLGQHATKVLTSNNNNNNNNNNNSSFQLPQSSASRMSLSCSFILSFIALPVILKDRIKEHDRDIRLAHTQTSAVSEHANKMGHFPLWNQVKFIDRDPHRYTRRVKEAIHIRLHSNNINRDSGIEIPEAWIPTIRKHNSRSTRRQTYEGTSSVSRNNNEDRNAPITANQRA